MIIRVQNEDFDSVAVQQELVAGRSDIGAIASFIGLVRDLADDPLLQMTLEHYPGMTEKALERIADLACQRWQVLELAIIHRIGALRPADQIVLVMVASAHRGDAFAACEFIMDYLKNEAPFWKKEASRGGDKWVEARKSDLSAQKKWNK
jgi:molybdopterin synthase catalytic subunit